MNTSAPELTALMGYPLNDAQFAIYTDRMFVETPGVYGVIAATKLAAWLQKRNCPECAPQVILMRAFNCEHIKFAYGDLYELGLKPSL